jgi:hypothetical protein
MFRKYSFSLAALSLAMNAGAQVIDPYDLVYNPNDGTLAINTDGGPLLNYVIEGGPFFYENHVSAFGLTAPSYKSSTENYLGESYLAPNAVYLDPMPMGSVLPAGLSMLELQTYFTSTAYVYALGQPIATFEIVRLDGGPTATPQNNWLAPTSGDWLDPTAWSLGQAPVGVPHQDVTIAATGYPYTISLDQSLVIRSLTLDSPDARVFADVGTASNALFVTDGVNLRAGVLEINGALATPSISAAPGALLDQATLNNDTVIHGTLEFGRVFGKSITLDDAHLILDAANPNPTLQLDGGIQGSGTITLRRGLSHQNFYITLFSEQTLGDGLHFYSDGGKTSIQGNNLTALSRFTVAGSDDSIALGTTGSDRSLHFAGHAEMQAGRFILGSNRETLTIADSAIFDFQGGALAFNAKTWDMQGRTFRFDQAGTVLDIQPQRVRSGRIEAGPDASVNLSAILEGITLAGAMTLERGNVDSAVGEAVLTLDSADITLVGSLGGYANNAWAIEGVGTIDLQLNPDASPFFGRGTLAIGGDTLIGAGITVRNTLYGSAFTGNATLLNQGTIHVVGPNAELDIDPANFRNEGTLIAEDGATLIIAGSYQLADLGQMQIVGEDSEIVLRGEVDNAGNVFDLAALSAPVRVEGAGIFGGTVVANPATPGVWTSVGLHDTKLQGDLVIDSSISGSGIGVYSSIELIDGATIRIGAPGSVRSSNFNVRDSNALSITGEGRVVFNATSLFNIYNAQSLTIGPDVTLEHQSGQLSINKNSNPVIQLDGGLISTADHGKVFVYADLVNNGTVSIANGTTLSIPQAEFYNAGTLHADGEDTFVSIYHYTPQPGGIVSVSSGATVELADITGLGNYALDGGNLWLHLGTINQYAQLTDIGSITTTGEGGSVRLSGWIDVGDQDFDVATLLPERVTLGSTVLRGGRYIASDGDPIEVVDDLWLNGASVESDIDFRGALIFDAVDARDIYIHALNGPDNKYQSNTNNDLRIAKSLGPTVFENVRLAADLFRDYQASTIQPDLILRGTLSVDTGYSIRMQHARYVYEGDFTFQAGELYVTNSPSQVSRFGGAPGDAFTLGAQASILMSGGTLELGGAEQDVTIHGTLQDTRTTGPLRIVADHFRMTGSADFTWADLDIQASRVDLEGAILSNKTVTLNAPIAVNTGQIIVRRTLDLSGAEDFENLGLIASDLQRNAQVIGGVVRHAGLIQALDTSTLTIQTLVGEGGALSAQGGTLRAAQTSGELGTVQAIAGGRVELDGRYRLQQALVTAGGHLTLAGEPDITQFATVIDGRIDLPDSPGLLADVFVYDGLVGLSATATLTQALPALVTTSAGLALMPGGELDLEGLPYLSHPLVLEGGTVRDGAVRYGPAIEAFSGAIVRVAIENRSISIDPAGMLELKQSTLDNVAISGGPAIVTGPSSYTRLTASADIDVMPGTTLTLLSGNTIDGVLRVTDGSPEPADPSTTLNLAEDPVLFGTGVVLFDNNHPQGASLTLDSNARLDAALRFASTNASPTRITGPQHTLTLNRELDLADLHTDIDAKLRLLIINQGVILGGAGQLQLQGDLRTATGSSILFKPSTPVVPSTRINVQGEADLRSNIVIDFTGLDPSAQGQQGVYHLLHADTLIDNLGDVNAIGIAEPLVWQVQRDAYSLFVVIITPGDTDADGDVDDSDLATAFTNYTGPAGPNSATRLITQGDADGDGDVDDSDLGTIFAGYTQSLNTAAVPEPTTGALFALFALGFRRRRA